MQVEENDNIFSCGICCVFSTDDLNKLESHVRKPRLPDALCEPTNSEWVVKTRNRDKENFFCKLCSYSTAVRFIAFFS